MWKRRGTRRSCADFPRSTRAPRSWSTVRSSAAECGRAEPLLMRALRIHEAATDEAAEAAAWYERERPGLGAAFEHAVDVALDLLEEDIVPLASVPGAAGKRG